MALGSCHTCLKYTMFFFNCIFMLVGCALVAIGIWVKVGDHSLNNLGSDASQDAISWALSVVAWILIIIGSITMIIGFLGCCGAIRESQCMLATFFVFLLIIFIVLLAIGIFIYMAIDVSAIGNQDPVTEEKGRSLLKDCVTVYYDKAECKEMLDTLHDKHACCGAEKGDFLTQYGAVKAVEACGPGYAAQSDCGSYVAEHLQLKLKEALSPIGNVIVAVVAVAFTIATIMLLGMIFSMMLCCAIRETMV